MILGQFYQEFSSATFFLNVSTVNFDCRTDCLLYNTVHGRFRMSGAIEP